MNSTFFESNTKHLESFGQWRLLHLLLLLLSIDHFPINNIFQN